MTMNQFILSFVILGYNVQPQKSNDSSIGFWSDGTQTTVDVGVWGQNEPNSGAGQCARINIASLKWYMAPCYSILPHVCEMDPCPAGKAPFKYVWMTIQSSYYF